ncbi:DNA topoisomerase 2 [Ancistrocladus abbreviatus]
MALPLQTSNNANIPSVSGGGKGKTIEETYQKKSQLEHILLRPDTYIGSVEKHTQKLWVYEDNQMVHKEITYVPGLYKIFDEILVNAADNKQRDPSMNAVKVTIDVEQNCISVYNNGDGVPVEIHQEEMVYVPELIFGHLLTSSNYDDTVKKTTGGRNGYGAKLTNIFSTEFVIETADGRRQKKYKQVFSNNMGKKSEPTITKCKEGENWTKVTFKPDLAKFNMTHLEDDVVALMKKRVVDLAGCLGDNVKVELNGKKIPVKSFQDYIDLYLQTKTTEDRKPPRFLFTEKRWEICVSVSDGQFQQVSFVNSIATIKGGTHVDYITNQVTHFVMDVVNKKKKNANVKAHTVKNHLWIFVNSLIDNPAFDSQTKETLTTRSSSFGSTCKLPDEFLKKVASKSGVVESLISWADFKQSKDLKKTDGTKRQRLTGIAKLDDANEAGGRHSEKCTLILTEGDSAKALAMSGLGVVGRDYYGVFPLRGKLLNVREASHKQVMDNAEIQNLKRILGLQQDKKYEDVKSLRYGHLMIMTDQDHDGSHIKGLLINFVHTFWPSLLRVPSFLVEFITPLLKATHRSGKVLSFYSMPDYEAWLETLGGNLTGWTIKYYKGLGTSNSNEGKEYFKDLEKHRKDFVWRDEQDGDAIELAFSKKKIEARKSWLLQYEPGTALDQREKYIKYSDFVHKELILFSLADLQRSIPSMYDGLKPGQRKVLFCAFKRNLVKEAKISQFGGYVSEKSAYHHGEQSIYSTIIGMAQDFVGSNNINLLEPAGQFGTRCQGGKDHASARYINTRLTPMARFLFPKEDDMILDYLKEDGLSVEPTWYLPVIPMVLVNGSEGIGTGWSSYIPNYNPRDIIANIRRLLNGENVEPMDPWYRGFKGTIEKTRDSGFSYTVTGIIEEVDETTVRITELPIRRWTQDYKEFLESIMADMNDRAKENDKIKDRFIKDFRDYSTDTIAQFEVTMEKEKLFQVKQEGLLKKFKLTTTITTSNMHLFDKRGLIKKYENPEQILIEFFDERLEFYGKRKKFFLDNLEKDLLKLENKVRFILGVVNGEIRVSNRKRAELVNELRIKGFTPFPKKGKTAESAVVGADDESEEAEENSGETTEATNSREAQASDYDYLLSMAIGTLTYEKVQELCAEKDKVSQQLEELRMLTPESLWLKDLDALEIALDEQDRCDAEKAADAMNEAGAKASRQAAKKPTRKNNKKANNVEPVAETAKASAASMMETDDPPQAVKGRGGPRKAPGKKQQKSVVVEEDEEEEDMEPLRARLAAYNLDSSPENSAAMETDALEAPITKKEPSKREAAKKNPTTVEEISDDDQGENKVNDEDFEAEVVAVTEKKGRGRGTKTNAKTTAKTTAAAAKKRGPAGKQSQLLGQKLITQILKPSETSGISPEKKVRKMRASPFNKKSGSVLGGGKEDDDEKADALDSIEEGTEVMPTRRRSQREAANRKPNTFVLSDSDESEEEEPTDDSDFDDEEDDE